LQQDTAAAIGVLFEAGIVSKEDTRAIERVLQQAEALFAAEPAYLAHGDFDPTHIFYDRGIYTGIIDFGEIRGTPRWYDVGHFAIENADLLPDLLTGYRSTTPISADDRQHIHIWSLLIAVRRSGRRLNKYPEQVYKPDMEAIQRGLQMLI
jgi:Ser/Thr protein kinase RdoA (MazF antagonist)